jgi:hypothetical protein
MVQINPHDVTLEFKKNLKNIYTWLDHCTGHKCLKINVNSMMYRIIGHKYIIFLKNIDVL